MKKSDLEKPDPPQAEIDAGLVLNPAISCCAWKDVKQWEDPSFHFLWDLWKHFVRHADRKTCGLWEVYAFILACSVLWGLTQSLRTIGAAPVPSPSYPQMHIREELAGPVMVCLPCWALKMQGKKPSWVKLGSLSLEVITCNVGKQNWSVTAAVGLEVGYPVCSFQVSELPFCVAQRSMDSVCAPGASVSAAGFVSR